MDKSFTMVHTLSRMESKLVHKESLKCFKAQYIPSATVCHANISLLLKFSLMDLLICHRRSSWRNFVSTLKIRLRSEAPINMRQLMFLSKGNLFKRIRREWERADLIMFKQIHTEPFLNLTVATLSTTFYCTQKISKLR